MLSYRVARSSGLVARGSLIVAAVVVPFLHGCGISMRAPTVEDGAEF